MNDFGARMEVMLTVPSLQDLARRAYCMELTLSGEYSSLCLRFIQQCVCRAISAENALPGAEVTEVVRERSSLVVKTARWFAHNMLFRCGAILSSPFVDQRLIGTHVDVVGDGYVQVGRGAYVVLQTDALDLTGMYAWGRERRTRSGNRVVYPSAMGGSKRFLVGEIVNVGMEYHGLVALVWGSGWEMEEEEYLYDKDTLSPDLVYDLVILGSTQVFDGSGWDILYHHLSRWATTDQDNVWYDNV